MPTSRRQRLADGLARAFLAGSYRSAELRARGVDALGGHAELVASLVRSVRRAYRTPPALEALTDFLASRPALEDAVADDVENDIALRRIFLGPSDEGRPVPALAHLALPDLPDASTLAHFVGQDVPRLEWLADTRRLNRRPPIPALTHYLCRWIEKRGGTHRLLEAPKPRLRGVQRRLLRHLLDHVPAHEAAHGFVRGRSPRTFADPHVGKRVVIRLDLEDFFNTIAERRVVALFLALGYARPIARRLAGLTCVPTPEAVLRAGPRPRTTADIGAATRARMRLRAPHLPQGAPTSPALANLVAHRLDVRLTALAAAFGAVYTRYADDLAFSGTEKLAKAAAAFVAKVAVIVRDEGFDVRFRKTRIMRASQRQELAGIVVNEKPSLRRADVERLEAILYNCVRHGPASQNRDDHPDFRAHLLGRLAWVEHVAPHRASRLRALFEKIVWD